MNLASVGVVNRASIASYAGTSLYQVFVHSSDLILAENYALAAVGLVAIVLLALGLATAKPADPSFLSLSAAPEKRTRQQKSLVARGV